MRSTAAAWTMAAAVASSAFVLVSCGSSERPLAPRSKTWAELRTVRKGVLVTPPGENERLPYPRERLVDGEKVRVDSGGLAWLRRDGGASLLIAGPALLELKTDSISVQEGKVLVDTPPGASAELTTPRGPLHLSGVRASLEVAKTGLVSAYVLSGEVRTDGAQKAGPGEQLELNAEGASKHAVVAWEDWTGGLATTDRAASPAPFGVGTVGARSPGETGKPRWPLAIHKLEVRVDIRGDLAITEVEQTFFNPTSAVVEGIYSFRTPPSATFHRFGVDREDEIVWGYVKEKQQAAAQYQAHVYAGSTEDPALLEWDAPGVYRARLYPIAPGGSRRVVSRYAEWLPRTGLKGERRLYVYPMAAEGAESTLPRIEELTITVKLGRANAKDVRVGMDGVRDGESFVVRGSDVVPRADLAVELFDEGIVGAKGFRAPHTIDPELLPPDARAEAQNNARTEADYLVVPVRPSAATSPPGGLDLAIVVDASAATDPASMAIARAATNALLAHLGKDDRAAVWAGDVSLRPVTPGSDKLEVVDEKRARAIASGLAQVDRGGATDLGSVLAAAASKLDPARRGAVVYIGDGKPTVGELSLASLREKLDRLPRPVRLFTFGVGDDANMGILAGVTHGAFSERISDANAAARAALRLLEEAERPTWLGATVNLGTGVDRVYPRDIGARPSDESLYLLGRISGTLPREVSITGPAGKVNIPLAITGVMDDGDMMRRWAEGRLVELLDTGAGRAAVVEVGMRYGVITPFTSVYVPTTDEARAQNRLKPKPKKAEKNGWFRSKSDDEETEQVSASVADNKEGGTGTRAKGEEGSMGNPNARPGGKRYGVAGPKGNADPHIERSAALREAAEFGMIGLLNTGAGGDNAPTAPSPAAAAPPAAQAAATATAAPMAKGGPRPVVAEDKQKERSPGAVGGARGAARADANAVDGTVDAPSRPQGSDTRNAEPAPAASAASAAWGRDDSIGNDLMAEIGAGGLGLSGVGEGGGGLGDGIGLGNIGSIGQGANQGFGSGQGRLGGSHSTAKDGKELTKKKPDDGLQQAALIPVARPAAVSLGDFGHRPIRCGPAASIPLEDRIAVWRERLAPLAGNVPALVRSYRIALIQCEAPTWRERSRLLSLMVDIMGTVNGRVALWRALSREPGVGDAVYGMILVRIRNAAEMRQLHDALGIRTIEPTALAKVLESAKTPAEKVVKLRALVVQWPDDLGLQLRLLDALEDAGDLVGARDQARSLRLRPNADASIRTAVGELYFRLAAKGGGAADEQEALRTFGEIVEFAPEDPVARRRLGDLLRAHNFFAEAARQYETLERSLPDDVTVPLLRAFAANGLGKTEEAVRWTEKASGSNAPDGASGSAKTARAIALNFLAWARQDVAAAKRPSDVARLRTRAKVLLASESPAKSVRIALSWSHPDFHPVLWTDVLGAMMPASDGDAMLGISQANLPLSKKASIEVRLDAEEARIAMRFGLQATLTAVVDEGSPQERIVRIPIRITPNFTSPIRFSVSDGMVSQEGQR